MADAHIYDRHVPIVERILNNPQYAAPRLIMDDSVTDFYKFTKDSFTLVDYKYNEFKDKIPVAI